MYQTYFGLTEKPFAETPNPDFLYLSTGHREGLAHLEYNILDGKGFSVLIGEVGTGKTTLCKALIHRLDEEHFKVIHIIHSDLDFKEFLREVIEALGLTTPALEKWDLLKTLNDFLIEAHGQNRRVIILIDEAQNLTPPVLEGIRMLSNLETPREKMIQIVFVGQPGFLEGLQRPDLLQLKQRIAGRYHLGPLTREETHGYIETRLNRVRTQPDLLFTAEAMDLVFQFSHGIPRLINFLCDFSLTHAYVAETTTVSPQMVQKAFRELQGFGAVNQTLELKETLERGQPPPKKKGTGLKWLAGHRTHFVPSNLPRVYREKTLAHPRKNSRRKTLALVLGSLLILIVGGYWVVQVAGEGLEYFSSGPSPHEIIIPIGENERGGFSGSVSLEEKGRRYESGATEAKASPLGDLR
jgi:type II secretory pathway predicted ATPase ExeA